jgi:hypothetical protein
MARNLGARVRMLAARLLTFARMSVVAAGTVTALSMGAVVTLQLGFWFMTRRWSPFPVSRILELWEADVPRTYALASDTSRLRTQSFTEWLLDLPAIVVLSVALALLALIYAGLTSLDKGRTTASVGPRKADLE